MKTTILIFALFCFSFTLENSDHLPQGDMILIEHNTGNGFIEIEISIEAVQHHLDHGDRFPCDAQPPDVCN